MTIDTTIALLGGSGLGPWAWERIVPTLRANGHVVLTPQLRSTGDDSTAAAAVTLDAWVEDVHTALVGDRGDIMLVAHSFAGYITAAVLERYPSTINQLVLLDAALPQPGKSWFDVMGNDVATFITNLAHDGAIPWFTKKQLDQTYLKHGLNDTDFAWMKTHLTPQPVGTYMQPAISYPMSEGFADVTYVRCVNTEPHGADTGGYPGWAYRTLDAGHWPMITAPSQTAQTILDLVTP